MDEQVVKKCFYDLKLSIEEFYSKNAQADTEGLIDLRSVLRGCAKLEYALNSQYKNLLIMEQEDRELQTVVNDMVLDTFFKKLKAYVAPSSGPTSEMRQYAANEDEKQNRVTNWAVALGRLEIARDEVERLKKLEEDLRIAKDS
jgi:rubrerythrin